MPSQSSNMVVVSLMIAAMAFFLYDVSKWHSLQTLINRRVKTLRIILLVIIESLLTMFLFRSDILAGRNPLVQLSYWSIIVAGSLAAVVVALLDVREVLTCLRKLNKDVFRSLKEDSSKK